MTGVMTGWYSSAWISLTCDSTACGSYYYNGSSGTADSTGWVTVPTTWTYPYVDYEPEPETNEQKRARLQREEERQRQQEELHREQEAAVKRAEELLKEHIGVEAFGKLHEVGYIELDSLKHKGHTYRVPKNHMSMIEVLDGKGKVVDKLCVHPAIECPPADHILTRIVLLESAEEFILAGANHNRT